MKLVEKRKKNGKSDLLGAYLPKRITEKSYLETTYQFADISMLEKFFSDKEKEKPRLLKKNRN